MSFLSAFCIWQYSLAMGEVFESSKDYLCVTETALFAAPKLVQHGEWSDPPSRFSIHIQPCETYCLPQRSRERPLSLLLREEGSDWPIKFEGYRGRADYHSAAGGSIILSADGLSLTRTMIGSMPGAEQKVSLALEARCHPME